MTSPAPTRAARLFVDLDAVAANYRHLKALAPQSAMAAVVKANAYGLGADSVAQRLVREGCDSFFLATAPEGAALRAALGDDVTLWVLNGFEACDTAMFKAARLSPLLNSAEQVDTFNASGLAVRFALHIDTAMNRLGVSPQQAAELSASGLNPSLVMSHLACAEDDGHPLNETQRARFAAVAARFPDATQSLANTGGVFLGPDYQFDLCRPGIGLFGATARPGQDHGLTPVATLEAPILQLRQLNPGDPVGYGASFIADRPLLAATVAAGYADGLPRALSGKGWARLGGVKTPILGRISMDLTVLDVTEVAGAVKPGETVSFLGEDLDALSQTAGTLAYELLTGVGAGVERVVP